MRKLLLCFVAIYIKLVLSSKESKFEPYQDDGYNRTIKVLCVVDYDTYEIHGKNDQAVQDYFSSFWKTVDHYVRQLPMRVGISLVKIEIARSRDEIPYMEYNRSPSNHSVIYARIAQKEAGNYLASQLKNKFVPEHNIAVVITQSSLCSEVVSSKLQCESFESVTMAKGKACSTDKLVAFVRDTGKLYHGIRRALVSIGSLLGAVFDGSSKAENCPATEGYFMSPIVQFDYSYKHQWSPCSINMINKFLFSGKFDAHCFLEKYSERIDLSKTWFPGQEIGIDDYCRHLKPRSHKDQISNTVYSNSENVCTELICKYSGGLRSNLEIMGPALEGSWCGKDKRCNLGKCESFPL